METAGVKERDIHKLSPTGLWKHFIAKRQPVKITGHLQDPEWHASERWTDDYLVKQAGRVPVEVEQRSGQQGYGRGTKTSIAFGDFVKRAAAGDASLYLSTQEATVAPDGHPHVLTSPVAELAGDYPLQPALMGKLVPQAINMWMGVAPEGATSGLHHDFHDNLYILLRGQKRFRLYPPSQASNMYTHGTLAWVHPNGRIVYKGQGDILADGTDAAEVQRWRERTQAEAAVAAAEAAVASGKKGAKRKLAAAERQLEALLEGALDGDGADAMHDDFEDGDDSDDGGSDDGDEGQRARQKGPKRRKCADGAVAVPDKQRRQPAAAAGGGAAGSGSGGAGKGSGRASAGAAAKEPPSFSRVDLSGAVSDKALRKQWPLFPGKKAAITVQLEAGEMLYLPAGWFHEVTSVGGAAEGGHLAANYWFHPPDNLDRSEAGFNQPYTNSYLPSVWAGRQAWLAKEVANAQQQRAGQAAPSAAAANGNGSRAAAGAAKGELGGALRGLKLGKRKVEWDEEVNTPPNKYRQCMTKDGTASGDVGRIPMLEAEQHSQAAQHPKDQVAVMRLGAGNSAAGSSVAGAGASEQGAADSGGGSDGGAGASEGGGGEGKREEDGDAEGAPVEDPEAARAAVSEWMKTDGKGIAKLLFAQFLQANADVFAGDDGDDDSEDENVGVSGGGTLQRVAVRVRRPPPGRRHHLFVSIKRVPRRRAPQ